MIFIYMYIYVFHPLKYMRNVNKRDRALFPLFLSKVMKRKVFFFVCSLYGLGITLRKVPLAFIAGFI